MRIQKLMLSLASALAFCSSVNAELITATNVIALETAKGKNYYYNYRASNGNVDESWVTQDPNGASTNYFVNGQPNPVLVFDLGANQLLDAFSIWGYPASGNSVREFTLSFYDASQGFDGEPIAVQNVTLSENTRSATSIALAAPTTAQYVKMEMTGNWGQITGTSGGDRVGFAEIQFNRTNTVETWIPDSAEQIAAGTWYDALYPSNLLDGKASTWWCTKNATNPDYYDGVNEDPVLAFTFNEAKNLSSITVTPYGVAGNSIRDFNLKFYDATGIQIAVADDSAYSFRMVSCNQSEPTLFTFPEVAGAAKVVMTITDNFEGGLYGGGDRVGLADVSFGNHIYSEGPTWQTSYNTPMEGLNVVRPDAVSINYSEIDYGQTDANYSLNNLIAGTGYSSGGEWCTIANGADYFNTDTMSVQPVLTFTNDASELADGFLFWGYQNKSGNGMTAFTLSLYDDDELVFSDYYRIDAALGKSEYASFMFDSPVAFDTAVLIPLDNAYKYFDYADKGGDRLGFAGFAFYQDPNKVPEPATWALLALGLAVLPVCAGKMGMTGKTGKKK